MQNKLGTTIILKKDEVADLNCFSLIAAFDSRA